MSNKERLNELFGNVLESIYKHADYFHQTIGELSGSGEIHHNGDTVGYVIYQVEISSKGKIYLDSADVEILDNYSNTMKNITNEINNRLIKFEGKELKF